VWRAWTGRAKEGFAAESLACFLRLARGDDQRDPLPNLSDSAKCGSTETIAAMTKVVAGRTIQIGERCALEKCRLCRRCTFAVRIAPQFILQ
jgi:hypothetical protein